MTTLRQAVQEFVADYDCGGCGHFAAYAERFRSSLAQPDNTTTLREAAQQALEALKVATTPLAKDRQEVLRAQDALRAALAQQDAPVEPVAWMFTDREGTEFFEQREDWDGWWTPLYTAPPQRMPLTEDKPWVCACGANLYIGADGKPRSKA